MTASAWLTPGSILRVVLLACLWATVGCHDVESCSGPACSRPNAGSCETGHHACGDRCAADDDIAACGASCVVCRAPAHAVPTCDGTCGVVCENGYGDCNGDLHQPGGDGCETDLSLPSACGACDKKCPADAMLCAPTGPENLQSVCVSSCLPDQTQCAQSCAYLASDVDHCGGCDIACDRTTATSASCAAATCSYTCAPGFGDCNKTGANLDGCETQINGNDLANCGGCGTTCTTAPAHASPVCVAGGCDFKCASGHARNGNACEIVCQGDSLTRTPFAGGTGTPTEPYIICSVAQLDQVRNFLSSKYFALFTDLDLTGSSFAPIGAGPAAQFTGHLEGNGFHIANWTYTAATTDYVGLFANAGIGSSITNLALENVMLVGHDHVGALAASGAPRVDHVTVSGSVQGHDIIGGLVGSTNIFTIESCSSSATVSGASHVGGLVGEVGYNATVSRSFASGAVTGSGNEIGGLVGQVQGGQGLVFSVIRSYATGAVNGVNQVGGLVGRAAKSPSAIGTSYASGAVTGTNQVGGLVGASELLVVNAYATGAVTGANQVGGLVGWSDAMIAHSFTRGAVTGTGAVGGLVGALGTSPLAVAAYSFWDTQTSNQPTSIVGTGKTTAELKSAATFPTWDTYTVWSLGTDYPTFRATPAACVVGAAGFAGGAGTLASPYLVSQPAHLYNAGCNLASSIRLTNDIDFSGQSMVPPIGSYENLQIFTGDFDGNGKTISNWVYYGGAVGLVAYAFNAKLHDLTMANVEVGGSYNVGAALALGMATVTNVHASGLVRGAYVVGGLVGQFSSNGGVATRSSSSATVIGSYSIVGGLMGSNYGSVSNCYATGAATGQSSGGLIGTNFGPINNSYSTGAVTNGAGFTLGGSGGTTGGCYWDTQTSGQSTSNGGGTGKTTAQMQDVSTFAGWDFTTIWQPPSNSYPTLR